MGILGNPSSAVVANGLMESLSTVDKHLQKH